MSAAPACLREELGGARRWALAAAGTLVFALLWWQIAWLDDDGYITLRSVLHWIRGHGPVWNTAERVQTYTHPLWMLLLRGAIGITGEFFLTTLALSALCSFAAAWLVLATLRTPQALLLVLSGVLASKAFFEYTSSGLENPLCYLLLAAFVLRYLGIGYLGIGYLGIGEEEQRRGAEHRLGSLMLLAGLSVLTRMDTLLFYAPALLALVPRTGVRRWLGLALLGFAPFVLWSLFAFVYYGSPFPITAYAKSFRHGIGQGELLVQALRYCADSLRNDPWTLPFATFGLTFGIVRGGPLRALALGGVLYLLYVLKIGGDFMSGRFFALPYWLALLLVAAQWRKARPALVLSLAALALATWAVLHAPVQLAAQLPPPPPHHPEGGIVDEWRYYYRRGGLRSPERDFAPPGSGAVAALPPGVPRNVLVLEAVGLDGLRFPGPATHILDPLLCDPLLARLPTFDTAHWRVGHWMRRIPDGYVESLTSGENRLLAPELREFYADLRLVLRAPVFARERLAALGRLWLGRHDAALRAYVEGPYRHPPRRVVDAARLRGEIVPFRLWNDPHCVIVPAGGLEIRFPAPIAPARLRIGLDSFDVYELRFYAGEELRHRHVQSTGAEGRVLLPFVVTPYELALPGVPFDRVLVDARAISADQNDFARALGWLHTD